MSVVVAIKDGDKVWVGCDSQVTTGYTKSTLKSQMKIWKSEDDKDIVMGLVGDCRDNNILSTTDKWIEELVKLKDEVNFKYVVRNVVPKIFRELNQYGRMRAKDGIQSIESTLIFAHKDKAYIIYSDGCVAEIEDMEAIGSGGRLSTGAINIIKNDTKLTAKEKLIKAIKTACESDLYVNYPIVIMNTEDDEIIMVDK